METINNNQKEQAIIGIIKDSIIWSRIANKMFDIVNAFHPDISGGNHNEFEPENHFSGYVNAFKVMCIYDDDDLCEQLGDLYWNTHNDNNTRADELAEKIYIEWLVCIRNYCVTLKTVA